MDILAVGIYLVLRFCFNATLDAWSPWLIYLIEILFVTGALVYHRYSFKQWLTVPRQLIWLPLVALLAGLFVSYGVVVIGLPVPFDLSDTVGLALLLVGAPILEEFVFRYFLWLPFEKRGKRHTAWWFSTLLFAYAHWHPVWHIPFEWQGFLAYQTLYTLGLGLACGSIVYLWRSLPGAILVHAAFNLGFWLILRLA